ncbi:pilus (MSHA type) biogenesis protein MshL [Desulfotalea psychrophila]|uniref:Related to type II protein secretion protein n=1 Tax=Desulfotalea psychrophila (strain LSv54 / DSM 12343) TaxID=177439 RepID=Q6AS33_DESPS|nr:pilus (MSHA type) biogenesis protein MshL [Desulfotalea psychrophila]CAG34842.1 related to type II protein secretion protein [Desulfotalea psychrophila LSv54]
MKSIKNIFLSGSLLLLILTVSACGVSKPVQPTTGEKSQQAIETADISPTPTKIIPSRPKPLPVQYQTPRYKVDQEEFGKEFSEEATSVKVGATIRSSRGPQPLADIIKRLASLKDMNVSWASDVNRDVLVDVDIQAGDDFYESLDNLLRQVDYFHEIQNNTIIVRYKETRQFHVAMPFIKSAYNTATGGNMLGNNEESENINGTVEIRSEDNAFDIWDNIQGNMDAILQTWRTNTIAGATADDLADPDANPEAEEQSPTATRRYAAGGAMYIIDKPIGLITVSAPRNVLDRLDAYFFSLKKELYKQIAIDAKIIEVTLSDASSIGIDWSNVLGGDGFKLGGKVNYGDATDAIFHNGSGFLDTITLESTDFHVLIKALNEQGDTKVLSNPKLSVMNGQPALISVGRSITYISEIEADRDTSSIGTSTITYTTETDSLLSGLGLGITATVLDDSEIIMNLVPVTSELVPFKDGEEIEYRQVGDDGASVGLPVLNVREMSTTVRVKDGETLIIGGLISESNSTTGSSVPILGSIPGLKYLFGYEGKSKQKKELVILIQPRII